ncbi:unnamed protein product, partial [Brenthis ino]
MAAGRGAQQSDTAEARAPLHVKLREQQNLLSARGHGAYRARCRPKSILRVACAVPPIFTSVSQKAPPFTFIFLPGNAQPVLRKPILHCRIYPYDLFIAHFTTTPSSQATIKKSTIETSILSTASGVCVCSNTIELHLRVNIPRSGQNRSFRVSWNLWPAGRDHINPVFLKLPKFFHLQCQLPEKKWVATLCVSVSLVSLPAVARSSAEALRRFSSGDLQSECDEGEVDPYTGRPATTSQPKPQNQRPASQVTGGSIGSATSVPPAPSSGSASAGGDLSLNLRGGSRGTSAPSSPAKSRESLLQRVQSLTGAARDQGANLLGSVTSVASVGRGYNRDRCVTLLVVDDQNTDWSKYFRGRRLPGEWDIRVEQAEFRELTVTANSDGTNVSMAVYRSGTKVTRCFKPEFVLIRQNVRDAGADHRALLLGLKFGGVPSINSLNSIYHFQDRPWVFGHLLQLQRRLGRENFPLIEQTYYHNHTDMVSF